MIWGVPRRPDRGALVGLAVVRGDEIIGRGMVGMKTISVRLLGPGMAGMKAASGRPPGPGMTRSWLGGSRNKTREALLVVSGTDRLLSR